MEHGVLTEQADLSPADWVVDRVRTFGENVASIIPEGFEAYGRLFHPAHRREGETLVPVRWSEVAEATGRVAHPEMQWEGVSGSSLYSDRPASGLWDEEPEVGNLPFECIETLVELLRARTTTPDRMWFCAWDGWGSHRLDPRAGAVGILTIGHFGAKPKPLPRRAEPLPLTLELPGRSYYLLGGPLEGALETMYGSAFVEWDPGWQSVNLWWPDDRAWFVSTEIDFPWTYIGGTPRLIDELVGHPDLEVLPARLDHGVTYDSDRVNPPPPPRQF